MGPQPSGHFARLGRGTVLAKNVPQDIVGEFAGLKINQIRRVRAASFWKQSLF